MTSTPERLMAPIALLLKSVDATYTTAFAAAGLAAAFSDVLSFEARNRDVLRERLRSLASYDGLIITSPRSSEAIVEALMAMDDAERAHVLAQLQTLPVFSVGQKTSAPLTALGVTCSGEASGSGDVLAAHIASVQDPTSTKPTLFLCGEKHHDALPTSFRARNQVLEELIVYVSASVSSIDYFASPNAATPAWVIFFSPSGVHTARAMLHVDWTTIKKAAIGKTTAAALAKVANETNDATWNADAVAVAPTPEGLLKAMGAAEGSAT
ncbi:uroporphyrinogen-III synthase [Saprolegnia diclina VS20]|uniref:Uroporphyrinogen-III synthase n=1 Tax=Saprolegnia diclina (strain VS20) TaxID=1156394 RepID=T0RLB3_SAPDV|nr:uroporphyrinogen-III synthase [Saprolegnia diclina VS20]EQC30742.1 uroporphyrinogen-III synthase [Saprolegnia diclina VS20]|eukprot:XP_008615766.1 uroporphyrinogen-III synthase [Saprolegnia diclina VS20]